MNTALRYAQNELKKLQRANDTSGNTVIDLVLIFDRSEADMKRLTGYPAFAQALEQLGGEHTEANIQEACRMSHFSRESVHFDDMDNGEPIPDYHIPIKCTKQQAKAMQYRQDNFNHSHFELD